jgi:predicted HAD superfamily Cof-like phosphohydrolase
LTEEISELAVAMQKNDVVDAADALIDLLYFAYGLGFKMGLPVDECFQVVHLANMRKSRGLTKRGMPDDATKPADWINPRQHLAALLDAPK